MSTPMLASMILFGLTLAVPGSAPGQQARMDALPAVFISAVRRIEPPAGHGAWVLQVISRGGFDGRGAGDLAISSDGAMLVGSSRDASRLPSETLSSLERSIRTATPSQWDASPPLGTCSDCLATLMLLTIREADGLFRTYTFFWDPTTRGRMSADVLQIHDLARTVRR